MSIRNCTWALDPGVQTRYGSNIWRKKIRIIIKKKSDSIKQKTRILNFARKSRLEIEKNKSSCVTMWRNPLLGDWQDQVSHIYINNCELQSTFNSHRKPFIRRIDFLILQNIKSVGVCVQGWALRVRLSMKVQQTTSVLKIIYTDF